MISPKKGVDYNLAGLLIHGLRDGCLCFRYVRGGLFGSEECMEEDKPVEKQSGLSLKQL